MTAQDIIKSACRHLAVWQPNSSQINRAFTVLNSMIDSWSNEGLLIHSVSEETFSLTVGGASYTIGSGGDFDTARPERIENAYIRDAEGIDYSLGIMTRGQYAELPDKDVGVRPDKIFYETNYPLGKIYFNSAPTLVETLHLLLLKPFTKFTSLTSTVDFPPGYERAITYALALEIAPGLEKDISFVAGPADRAIRNLKRTTSASERAEVKFDSGLTHNLLR